MAQSQSSPKSQTQASLYMCTSSGIKDGIPYSMLSRIVHGTKPNSDSYAFLDTKSPAIRENEQIELGTIIEYRTTRVN
jgi:predicted transcriptional regulator